MTPPPTEFDVRAFAKHYAALSDTFIDTRGAAESLKRMVPVGTEVFEIGLGTGYFASFLCASGYNVCGIQPPDEMLAELRVSQVPVKVVAESRLENYTFDRQYDAIVSHSSVFLFTEHKDDFGASGESKKIRVFQSFIRHRLNVLHNLSKVLLALKPQGRLFVNVQRNPLVQSTVGDSDDPFGFEMLRCEYDFDREVVEKTYRSIYRGNMTVVEDVRFCCTFRDICHWVSALGGRAFLSDDGLWVVFARN